MATATSGSEDGEGEWGWDTNAEEDSPCESTTISVKQSPPPSPKLKSAIPRINSLDHKQIALSMGSQSLQSGIASSTSFQELEKAIVCAQLAMSLTPDETLNSNYYHNSGMSPINRKGKSGQTYQHSNTQQRNFAGFSSNTHRNIPAPPMIPTMPTPLMDCDVESTHLELQQYLNESESRAMILIHSPAISTVEIKRACQKFGVLYYLRPEFHHRGVTFLSYFDLRSAINAYTSISKEIEVEAKYSIMLHAANSNMEEFKLLITGLPDDQCESSIQTIFSRYGPLRSIQRTFNINSNDNEGSVSSRSSLYSIEYFNIQDARHAASELTASSLQFWGTVDVSLTFSPLDARKQQLCSQLLTTLSRWRSETAINESRSSYHMYVPMMGNQGMLPNQYYNAYNYRSFSDQNIQFPIPMQLPIHIPYTYYQQQHCSENLLANSSGLQAPKAGMSAAINLSAKSKKLDDNASHISNMKNQNNSMGNTMSSTMSNGHHQRSKQRNNNFDMRPLHHIDASMSNNDGRAHNRHHGSNSSVGHEFTLDMELLVSGTDSRTTLMVRNIPNKYNQLMILEEVNVNHEGKYDFFYLPIDFKNKCNVGYFFINFLEPKFIVPFVHEFNGQRWKSFNSEKVCAVSFARIQGKNAMIARFQNSSLLEKDDEYRPLLFYSSGAAKGSAEPFPLSSKQQNRLFDPVNSNSISSGNSVDKV